MWFYVLQIFCCFDFYQCLPSVSATDADDDPTDYVLIVIVGRCFEVCCLFIYIFISFSHFLWVGVCVCASGCGKSFDRDWTSHGIFKLMAHLRIFLQRVLLLVQVLYFYVPQFF